MKNSIPLIIAICYFSLSNISAQQHLDCNFNFREALFYLKGNNAIKKDSLKAIRYLKPCVDLDYSKAQLLMGRLLLRSNSEESFIKGFELTMKAAEQGLPLAVYDLGNLYKYGKGCKQDFYKALKHFIKADQLGVSKASYSIGYFYLKGLGTTKQDYNTAISWFKKSNSSMANYWLAICYYRGYSVEKNQQTGIQYLKKSKLKRHDDIEKSFNISTQKILEVETKVKDEGISLADISNAFQRPSISSINKDDLVGS